MTTINPPKNSNYCAVIVQLATVINLDGCDNIAATPVLGHQAIVAKTTQPGDIGVVFTAETQLSDEFCRLNNLYTHTEHNIDPAAKGYLADNRRVRAIKLRGHRSDALYLPLSALDYTGVVDQLKPGDTFDELAGHEICRKYERHTRSNTAPPKTINKFVRVDTKFLPEHYDTARYHGNEHKIPADARIIITQKLHGTSLRVGNTITRRSPNWREKIAERWFKIPVKHDNYDIVYGSRRVIKDARNPRQRHHYDTDIWTMYGRTLDTLIPKSYIVYGELIGWTPHGEPIQKDYTYHIPENDAHLYVYRIAHINPEGVILDLSWGQVEEFCRLRGLRTVPVLAEMLHSEFRPEDWIDRRYHDTYSHALPLSGHSKLVDEGVCVRVDGLTPTILKVKSPEFLRHETKTLDDHTSHDLETEEVA